MAMLIYGRPVAICMHVAPYEPTFHRATLKAGCGMGTRLARALERATLKWPGDRDEATVTSLFVFVFFWLIRGQSLGGRRKIRGSMS